MKIQNVKINGTFSSENNLKEGTNISFGYRDLKTGKIKVMKTTKTYEYDGENFVNGKYKTSFYLSVDDVYFYEYGVEPIIIYNGKYRELSFKKDNFVGGNNVATVTKDIFDMKTTGNEKNFPFVSNSKTTIFDDPIVGHYVMGGYWGDFDEKAMNGISSEGESIPLEEGHFEGDGHDHGHHIHDGDGMMHGEYEFTNKKIVEKMLKEGKTNLQIFQHAYDKVDAGKILRENGFNEAEILKIKSEGMLKNIEIVQKKVRPSFVVDLEEYLSQFNTDGTKKEIKKANDLTSLISTVKTTNVPVEELEVGKVNHLEVIIFSILFIIILLGGGIFYFIKKKNNEKNKTI